MATWKSLESSLRAVESTSKCPCPLCPAQEALASGSSSPLFPPGEALVPALPSPPWMTPGNPDPFSELPFPQLQSENGKFHFLQMTGDWCVKGTTMMPILVTRIQMPRRGVCGNVLSQAGWVGSVHTSPPATSVPIAIPGVSYHYLSPQVPNPVHSCSSSAPMTSLGWLKPSAGFPNALRIKTNSSLGVCPLTPAPLPSGPQVRTGPLPRLFQMQRNPDKDTSNRVGSFLPAHQLCA